MVVPQVACIAKAHGTCVWFAMFDTPAIAMLTRHGTEGSKLHPLARSE